jgi:hypothetical protein
MKKIIILSLLAVLAISCSKDDSPTGDFEYGDALYGTWEVTSVDGTGILFDFMKASATFNTDGTYYGEGRFGTGSGTYTAQGNEIKCYVDDMLYATYVVHSLQNNKATMTLKIYGGSTYELRCEKVSSSSVRSVTFSLSYNLPFESGSMSRAFSYSTFYNKYVATKMLVPSTYNIVIQSETGTNKIEINGSWNSNDFITLPEGKYKVTGTSAPNTTYFLQDTVSLAFNEVIEITANTTSYSLNSSYDCYMLAFNADKYNSITFMNLQHKDPSKYLKDDIFFFFANQGFRASSTYEMFLEKVGGGTTKIDLKTFTFEKGKYYYFNETGGSFSLPEMTE